MGDGAAPAAAAGAPPAGHCPAPGVAAVAAARRRAAARPASQRKARQTGAVPHAAALAVPHTPPESTTTHRMGWAGQGGVWQGMRGLHDPERRSVGRRGGDGVGRPGRGQRVTTAGKHRRPRRAATTSSLNVGVRGGGGRSGGTERRDVGGLPPPVQGHPLAASAIISPDAVILPLLRPARGRLRPPPHHHLPFQPKTPRRHQEFSRRRHCEGRRQ